MTSSVASSRYVARVSAWSRAVSSLKASALARLSRAAVASAESTSFWMAQDARFMERSLSSGPAPQHTKYRCAFRSAPTVPTVYVSSD